MTQRALCTPYDNVVNGKRTVDKHSPLFEVLLIRVIDTTEKWHIEICQVSESFLDDASCRRMRLIAWRSCLPREIYRPISVYLHASNSRRWLNSGSIKDQPRRGRPCLWSHSQFLFYPSSTAAAFSRPFYITKENTTSLAHFVGQEFYIGPRVKQC